MKKYDLCVIGGGPAGYAAAMRAIDFGKRVILVEKGKLGGAGIYDGALASKAMWELSNKVKSIRDGLGEHRSVDVTFEEVKKVVNDAVFDRKFQLLCHLRIIHSENELITYEKGCGSFVDPHTVRIAKKDGEHMDIWAEHIVIASGSRPRKLDNIDVDEKTIMTSDGILHMKDFPKSLVILGAGVIGCEFAAMFSNFGKTKVYIIDKGDRILPFEDKDISDVVTANLEANGVVVHGTSSLIRMEQIDGEVEYEIEHDGGLREVIRVEKALLSVGRVANIEELNLEAAGVERSPRGVISDDDTVTNVPHIYAVGDVSGHIALVNVGEREARHAVVKMFNPGAERRLNYENVSTIMFLNPEVAMVGMNEQTALKNNIPIRVAKLDYSMIARAVAMRNTSGFIKLIVSDDDDHRVLGMRAVGEHASSAIQAVALQIYCGKGIDELAHMVYPHPSIIEGIQSCARMLLGKAIYKSAVFKDKLQCYRLVNGECIPLHTMEEMTERKNLNQGSK